MVPKTVGVTLVALLITSLWVYVVRPPIGALLIAAIANTLYVSTFVLFDSGDVITTLAENTKPVMGQQLAVFLLVTAIITGFWLRSRAKPSHEKGFGEDAPVSSTPSRGARLDEPFKICPRCSAHAHLTAASCKQCGRQYNTKF
jgi:hypothetical protein